LGRKASPACSWRCSRPPAKLLQQIADQLEQTGRLTSRTVSELRQIVRVMADHPTRSDMLAAELLAEAAAVLGSRRFSDTVERAFGGSRHLEREGHGLQDQ
jgi:hypothetical protein